ncbi:hypothetical protein [Paraburkholderia youngii]|uniref:hypothetical protein n=1 Tax=Paraburkholderia youngii TaxID=2782701 RepID=UPI003D1E16D6
MEATDNPKLMPVPFAQNGQRNDIPQQSQIGTTKGAASLVDGFPPATMTDPLKGGIPPFGKDVNGILYLLALTARWAQLGGSFGFDGSFANDPNVNGYPKGSVLLRADLSGFWFNLADSNTTDPDATDGSARNWLSLNPDWDATEGPGVILNRPQLAAVASSGQYDDLLGTPDIPAAQVNSDWNAESGVAEILNKPSIPAAQVNADWDATGGIEEILHKPVLAKVATSGRYDDLDGTPDPFILLPATTDTLGGIIAGSGLAVAADGTLATEGTTIVDLTGAASIALDLTPIVQGAPEILFNLTVPAGMTTVLSITNPPEAGVLAAFVLVVNNGAGSALVWPSNVRWPQFAAPALTGVAGVLDTFVIYTQDGGASYKGFIAGQGQ